MINRVKLGTLSLLMFAAIALALVCSSTTAYAQPPITILATSTNLSPSSSTVNVAQSFNVTVMVADVTNLYAWQAKLFFDPSVVQCASAVYPSDQVFAGKTTVPLTPQINNVTGFVLFGCSLQGDAATFTGTGKLCTFTFVGQGVGTSALNFSKPYGVDTYLLDFDLIEISATMADGSATVVPEFPSTILAITFIAMLSIAAVAYRKTVKR
ncbi:cohesin domain-containing protein [Candidatus Bathyarchaeota archaeon]|nr:cohesin domain-containing protein [Candidatus Bathyarchaeota archaeon]